MKNGLRSFQRKINKNSKLKWTWATLLTYPKTGWEITMMFTGTILLK